MMHINHNQKNISDKNIAQPPPVRCKRCGRSRRIEPSQGYYYSHTIGWVCRRELSRRKTDEREKKD